jgi:uncharacterized protein DUF397
MTANNTLTSAVWRKSSKSKDGECVEVAQVDDLVGVRDSKDPDGPVLRFTAEAFRDFVSDIKRGAFDL